LFRNALDLGDYPTAKSTFEHVRQNVGPSEEWAQMGATYFEKLGGAVESVRFLQECVRRNPYAWGPRIVLSRLLLKNGREAEAQEHLEMLNLLGNAEGVFYLGVGAMRRGDLQTAHQYITRAHDLNPYHEDTMKQLWNLERALESEEPPSDLNAKRSTLNAEQDWKEQIIALSHMPPVVHPHVFGRDASNPYYDFMYRLVEHYKPRLVVELGTCTGGSTSYLAAGCPETRVISVDKIQHEETVKRLSVFPNVDLWTYNTNDPAFKERLAKEGPIDILFIDTEHTYAQVRAEFESLCGFVRPAGMILLDDMKMVGMDRFWSELAEEKMALSHLHWSGFGLCRIGLG